MEPRGAQPTRVTLASASCEQSQRSRPVGRPRSVATSRAARDVRTPLLATTPALWANLVMGSIRPLICVCSVHLDALTSHKSSPLQHYRALDIIDCANGKPAISLAPTRLRSVSIA